jgi:hypothetical protein
MAAPIVASSLRAGTMADTVELEFIVASFRSGNL